ncbi:uncharacterized protein LOC134214143 isoform X2 [Armigeres subalbatus]|uniref:uncharacterized protein LOC134214143 isoform X2 n=1 Tax=Armigeres subalbatus TaxID=124917 RepID=UPI002ED2DA7C
MTQFKMKFCLFLFFVFVLLAILQFVESASVASPKSWIIQDATPSPIQLESGPVASSDREPKPNPLNRQLESIPGAKPIKLESVPVSDRESKPSPWSRLQQPLFRHRPVQSKGVFQATNRIGSHVDSPINSRSSGSLDFMLKLPISVEIGTLEVHNHH